MKRAARRGAARAAIARGGSLAIGQEAQRGAVFARVVRGGGFAMLRAALRGLVRAGVAREGCFASPAAAQSGTGCAGVVRCGGFAMLRVALRGLVRADVARDGGFASQLAAHGGTGRADVALGGGVAVHKAALRGVGCADGARGGSLAIRQAAHGAGVAGTEAQCRWAGRAAVLALAVALGGCAARVPAPPVSQLVLPEGWRSDAPGSGAGRAATTTTAAAVPSAWWEAYGDSALSALVARVLERNTDVRVTAARVAEFRARLAGAEANRAPTVSASLAPSRARVLAYNGVPYTTNLFSADFQAAYEVDLWGRLAHASEAAAQALAAEQANAGAARLAVAALATTGYLQLRGLDAQLELARATLDLREQSRRLAQRQFETGYTSRLEWLQAQAEYEAAAEQVPQLQRQVSEQENALSLLAGDVPGPVVRGRRLAELAPPEVPPGLPSALLKRRPDIARAAHNVAAARAGLQVTSEQLLPTFRLTAGGGMQSTDFSKFLHDPTWLWRAGVGLAAPLWDGGRVQAQTDAAAAQRDQAMLAYEHTVRTALVEVDNSLAALQRLREQIAQNDARRATAAETLRIARNRYRNGYASYLEELDAQRTLYSADVARLQLRTRLLAASVDLVRALGGGWQPSPPE